MATLESATLNVIVKINDFIGMVINLGLQNTKLKGFNGDVYTITNSNISSITN